ncbi:hypothetical protein AX16_000231 [Volvariella volvacea WC 439]|nr:hypothetical protein AX16_000231 [Volvariella volvacea WC 439]
MNQYGWGAMMDDYVFLEEIGRKIGDWGKEIVQGGYMKNLATNGARVGIGANGRNTVSMKHGNARMRGRGKHSGPQSRNSKRDLLKMQLEEMNIDVELLSVGMERRLNNHSVWDLKSQKPYLTVEFVFHPSPNPLSKASQASEHPFTVITHRNDISKPLLTLLRSSMKSKKDTTIPLWVKSLIIPDPSNEEGGSSSWTPPQCVLRARIDPLSILQQNQQQSHHTRLASYLSSSLMYTASQYGSRTSTNAPSTSNQITATHAPDNVGTSSSKGVKRKAAPRAYHRLDPIQPLSTSLQHTHFVEYPTIEIWEEFKGLIVDPQAETDWSSANFISPEDGVGDQSRGDTTRPTKRRKVASKKAEKKTIVGLLGGYGSGEDDRDENGDGKRDGLALLGNYGGSESEAESSGDDDGEDRKGLVGEKQENGGQMDQDIENSDEEPELDPAAVLELVKKVRGEEGWLTMLQNQEEVGSDGDAVDWGEDDDEEDAAS